MATNTPTTNPTDVMQRIKKASERSDAAQPAGKATKISLRPTIRLPDSDAGRLRDLMKHALSLDETINATTAVRLALLDWDFEKHMTAEKIRALRAKDGRYRNSISA